MENLLDENDFVVKQPDYNPWRWFAMFYAVLVVSLLGIWIYGRLAGNMPPNTVIFIMFFAFPPVLTFIMVFTNKNVRLLPFKIIGLGVFLLMGCYICSVLSIALLAIQAGNAVTSDLFEGMAIFSAIALGMGAVCLAVMYPILKKIRKRFYKKQQAALLSDIR